MGPEHKVGPCSTANVLLFAPLCYVKMSYFGLLQSTTRWSSCLIHQSTCIYISIYDIKPIIDICRYYTCICVCIWCVSAVGVVVVRAGLAVHPGTVHHVYPLPRCGGRRPCKQYLFSPSVVQAGLSGAHVARVTRVAALLLGLRPTTCPQRTNRTPKPQTGTRSCCYGDHIEIPAPMHVKPPRTVHTLLTVC